jgi:hypothetical protein
MGLLVVSEDAVIFLRVSYHCAESDQADQGIRRKQAQAHDDRVLERLQAILFLACVDNKHKNGGRRCWSSKAIFNGGAVWVQLGGYLLGRDVLVVWG